MGKKLYVTRNCVTTIRGKKTELKYGQEAPKGLGQGAVTSMLNSGLLTTNEGLVTEAPEDDSEPSGTSGTSADDWRATRVDAIDAIDKDIAKALNDAGAETLGGVIEYAKANDGLQGIKGIGEASEKQLQEVIAQHAQK